MAATQQPQMNIIDRTLARFGYMRTPAKRAPEVVWSDGYTGNYGEIAPSYVTNSPALYAQSEAVNAAVNSFANRVISTPGVLYRRSAEGDGEEVNTHKLLDLLDDPNPYLSRSNLFWYVVADLLMHGNAYWFLAGPNNGAPNELWRLNPRHVRLVRSKSEYIGGYVYTLEGVDIPLDVAEVIHMKMPNPFDEFYGIGKLATAALAAQTGYDMSTWNRGMFGQYSGIPAGIVTVSEYIQDPDFEQLKSDWRKQYGGISRKTAFLRGDQISFHAIGLNQTDVDFLEGSKWEAEKVYRVFGTYHLLPAEYADDRKVNERMFLEEHAWPMLVYISEIITDSLLPYFASKGRFYYEFDDIRPRERALDLEERREEAQGLTVNEWRAARQLEPLEGGDDVMFVHMVSGTELQFERDAKPEPPPQLAPFTGQDTPPEDALDDTPDDGSDGGEQTADENAEDHESAGNDVGDDVGEFADKAVDLTVSVPKDPVYRAMPIDLDDALTELDQLERFTLARLGKPDTRSFNFEVLPAYFWTEAQDGIEGITDPDDIKGAFAILRELARGDFKPPDVRVFASTASNYRTLLTALMERAFKGAVDSRNFLREGKQLIAIHFELAYLDGLSDGGVTTDTLSDDERDELELEIDNEQGYWTALRNQLFDALETDDDGQRTALQREYMARVEGWVNKGLTAVWELGKLSAQANGMFIWYRGPTSDSCKTCKTADGQIHRARDWKRKKLRPRSDVLLCNGHKCQCELEPTRERARGRLDRIPVGE